MSIPILPHIFESSICLENESYLEVHGVRIKPSFLEFKNAFEGRVYKQKIVIQNVSSNKVCVRITPPTSFAHKIKCVKNRILSPGLCLVREVIHIHSHVNADRSVVPIFIDDNCINYEIIVKECAAEITISPKTVNLGLVDVHVTTPSKILEIKNTGSKTTRFYVDIKSNADCKLLAYPRKGYVQPRCSVKIDIKMVSTSEGEITNWLWIKCDTPHIVPVTLTAIKPTFEIVDHPLSSSSTIIDFRTTYIGLQSTQKLLIRNYSAFETAFCIVGETRENVMDFTQCREKDDEFRHFCVSPHEGGFQSKELRTFHFIFKPTRPKPNEQLRSFYFCTVRMYRLKWKYLTSTTYTDGLFLSQEMNESVDYSWNASMLVDPSKHKFEMPQAVSSASLLSESITQFPNNEYQTFYLHATAELPSVQVVPDALHFTESLTIGQTETRVLEFINRSTTLPIVVWYKKSPYVEVDNYKVQIPPAKSIQVTVSLTTRNIEAVSTTIRFDLKYHNVPKTDNDNYELLGKILVPLVYHTKAEKKVPLPEINRGITPNYIKEAGKFCQNVKFKTKVVKPKTALIKTDNSNRNDLIALPNDLQRSLRPWRGNQRIKTIFTKAPRYIAPLDTDYEMTVVEKRKKLDTVSYYTNYTRKEGQRLRSLIKVPKTSPSDYDLTETDKLLCKDIRLPKTSLRLSSLVTSSDFIPLSPAELFKIIIDPLIVDVGKIAAHSRSNFHIFIKNANPFALRVYLRPEKSCIGTPYGNRQVVLPYSECYLTLTYISMQSGFYTTRVDLIINECCVFVVNVEADVHRPYLTTDVDVIEFDDRYIRYIEITNPLNSDTYFKWEIECQNFQIKPIEGLIKANCKMCCEIVYLANCPGPSIVDVELLASENPMKQVRFFVKSESIKQYFVTANLEFKDVKLNVPVTQTACIKNDSLHSKSFSLIDVKHSNYIQVAPMKGIIYGNSHVVIAVTLKMTSCLKFSEMLRFSITDSSVIVLHVKGNVLYPDVTITPQLLQFNKIPSSSIDTIRFVVSNRSDTKTFIKFDMSMYGEYTITEENMYWWSPPLTELELEKHCSKELYMHFTPNNVGYDKFFLPMIINDILGPVTDNMVTNQVSFYLDQTLMQSQNIRLPKTLPMPRVASQSVEPKLQFSKLKIDLNVCTPPYPYRNSYKLKISNVQKEVEEVCIRTDGLSHPFTITQISGPPITTYPNSMVYVLNPSEYVVFEILFQPNTYGMDKILLPIFLRSDNSSSPHNCLQITGRYDAPTITPISDFPFYKSGPLSICNVGKLKFIFKNHFASCKISFNIEVLGANLEILEEPPDSTNTRYITLTVKFNAEKPTHSIDYYALHCSCGVSHCVPLSTCRENCFLTNYAHMVLFLEDNDYNLTLKKTSFDSMCKASLVSLMDTPQIYKDEYDLVTFFYEYPFFPREEGPLREFQEGSIKVLQSWIFTQVFYGTHFYEIPTGFSYIIFKHNSVPIMPYINLLINLGGEEVKNHFQLEPPSEDNMCRTKYLHDVYEKALQFIIGLGARFGYIRTEHLLDFEHYRVFMTHFKDEDAVPPQIDISDPSEYCVLTKQTWLDVLFQTYKVLILQRLILGDKKVVTTPTNITCPSHIKYMKSIKNIGRNQHLFTITELLLLDWMQFHYNEVRETVWKEYTFLNPKDITCFDDGLDDGFVFAALTIAYCPYLIGHFEDMHFDPVAPEEFSHNNIKIILAWQILNFSYEFTVEDLEKTNGTRTLFLAVYLYQMLPNMYPSQTIEFQTGLSQRMQKSFSIKNANDFPVAYKAILYGCDDDCFEMDKDLYVIEPKSKVKICIDYWAKFIKESKCTLILSGECRGYRYARSRVISLIGIPDIQYVIDTQELRSMLCVLETAQITVSAPYKGAAIYRIQETNIPLTSCAEAERHPYRESEPNKSVLRITTMKSEIDFDEEGVASIDFHLCTISPRIIPLWIYFRNPNVGDFAIKVISGPKSLAPQERLRMYIQDVPVTGKSTVVPRKDRILTLNIPRQNRLLWQCVMNMFIKMSGQDIEFWKRHSQTLTGIHILTRIIKVCVPPYGFNLCAAKRFFIMPPKNCPLKFPKHVDIDVDRKADFISIPVEVQPRRTIPDSVSIVLESEDHLEFRRYEIILQRYPLLTDCNDNVERTATTSISRLTTTTDTSIYYNEG